MNMSCAARLVALLEVSAFVASAETYRAEMAVSSPLSALSWTPEKPAGGFSETDELEVSATVEDVVLTIDAPLSVRSLRKTGANDLVLANGGNVQGELAVAEGVLTLDAGADILDLSCDLAVAASARMNLVSTSATAPEEGRLVRLRGKTSGLGELYFGMDCSTNEILNARFDVMKAWSDKKGATFRVGPGATLGNVVGSTLVVRGPVTFAGSQTTVRSIVPFTNTPSSIDQFPIGVSSDPAGEYVFRDCAVTNALWFTNGRLVLDNCKARLLGVGSGISLNLGSMSAGDRYKEYKTEYFNYVPSGSVTSVVDILVGSDVYLDGAVFAGNMSGEGNTNTETRSTCAAAS